MTSLTTNEARALARRWKWTAGHTGIGASVCEAIWSRHDAGESWESLAMDYECSIEEVQHAARLGKPLDTGEREALFGWVRRRMDAEDDKVRSAKAEFDARRAAKGLPPTSHPTRESKVLVIAIELDLAPWDTKPVLGDDDLAVARALCEAAEARSKGPAGSGT